MLSQASLMKKHLIPLMRVARIAVLLLLTVVAIEASLYSLSPRLVSAPVSRTAAVFPDFVSIARRMDASLVHISTLQAPSADTGAAAPRGGLGSGIVLRADGHILTNHHVVHNADKVFVRLADRRELPARIIGRDERSDLALIKVAAPAALRAAPLGDSDLVQTGEWVVALGSPFGLDRTLTAGIVSAKARRLATSADCDYIQTDVTINPGNSGGPLLNLHGRVIGINTAILSRNGNNMGVNFAIPINFVKDVVPELLLRGQVIRGWIGLSAQTMSAATAARLGFGTPGGALVLRVTPESPAARAGIRVGDIVVGYDGKAVAEAAELRHLVARTAIGRSVGVYLHRGRMLHRALLEVRELPAAPESSPADAKALLTSNAEFHS